MKLNLKSFVLAVISTVIMGCGTGKTTTSAKSTEIPLEYVYETAAENAKGTEVNLYMWGGSEQINKFMDNDIAPKLKEEKDIILNRIPMNAPDFVNKLIVEKAAGKKEGTIDLVWINGENFKTLKDAGLLWGDYAKNLPNIKLVKESTTEKDFGEPILGMENPWGEAQFNFIYDGKNGNVPFVDSATLMEYVKANPGKFTYPSATDFTGNAFVRNMAIDILGYENISKMSDEELKSELNKVWAYFREMQPYLWRKGETYPENDGKLDSMFETGEVEVAMGYTINKVNSMIANGKFPESSKSFLLDKGTLFNNHYLSIPASAPNKAGAVVVADYLMSPEAQELKQKPEIWGDFTILDIAKLNPEEAAKFTSVEKANMPSLKELGEKRVPELSPGKLKIIQEGWLENVGKKIN